MRLFCFILLAACTSRRARAEFSRAHHCTETLVTLTAQGNEHFHMSGCGYEDDFDCRSQPCTKVRHAKAAEPEPASLPALADVDLAPLNKARASELRSCYDRSWQTNPTLNGYLFVEFSIEKDGSVANAKVVRSSVHDQTLEACVARVVSSTRFATRNAPANMSVPFIVRP